jgi:type I restriction enzyme S subunit
MTEGPYKLPEGWRWVRLGEVSRIYAGSPAPQGGQYFREGKWPFVRVQDLGRYGQTTCLKETADYVNEYALQKYHLRLAKAGTILFPKSGAAILTNSRAVLGVDAYIVSHLAAVEPLPDRLDTYWTYFWLCTVDMKQLIDNPSYPSLRLSEISKLLIPLPPLEEQRRIVARIEELMGRVREAQRLRQEAQKDAERLWQSVLAQTFPRPGSELPEGWRWVRLEEVCEIWDSLRKPVKKKYRHPGNVPYCGANGVIDYVDGFTHFGEFVLLAEDGGFYGPGEFSAYMMKGRFWANNHVHVLRGKPDQLLNQFLYHWLVTCDLRPFLTGATRPKLTQGAMRSILIPLPPLAEQRRIVAHLEAVQERLKALKEAQAATEAELKRLEQAILEKAFRGEL